jgi:hypothetical protein
MSQIEGRCYYDPLDLTKFALVPIACDRDGRILVSGTLDSGGGAGGTGSDGGTTTVVQSAASKPLTVHNEAIVTTNTSQVAVSTNLTRAYLFFQNNSPGDLWVNFGAAAAIDVGIKFTPGQSLSWSNISSQMHVFGLAGQKYAFAEA